MKRKRSIWEDILLYVVAFIVLLTYTYEGRNLLDGRIVPFLIGCGIAFTASLDWFFLIKRCCKNNADDMVKMPGLEYIRLGSGIIYIAVFVYNICI